MMIWENYKKGWSNTFNFTGRATRAEYWIFNILSWVFIFLLMIATLVPISLSMVDLQKSALGILIVFVMIPYSIAAFSQVIRRIRDTGVSGWWSLLFLPVNAILWGFPSLILGFIPSAAIVSIETDNVHQQKASPEIKDFHYTPPSQASTSNASTAPRPRLPLKDFN